MSLSAHQYIGEPCGQARKAWSLDTNVKIYDISNNCYKSQPLPRGMEITTKPKTYEAGELHFRYYKQLSQSQQIKVHRRNVQQNNVFTEKVFPELCQLHTENILRRKHEYIASLNKGYDIVQFDQAAEQLQAELESRSHQTQDDQQSVSTEEHNQPTSNIEEYSEIPPSKSIERPKSTKICYDVVDKAINAQQQEKQTYKVKIKVNYHDYQKFTLPCQ